MARVLICGKNNGSDYEGFRETFEKRGVVTIGYKNENGGYFQVTLTDDKLYVIVSGLCEEARTFDGAKEYLTKYITKSLQAILPVRLGMPHDAEIIEAASSYAFNLRYDATVWINFVFNTVRLDKPKADASFEEWRNEQYARNNPVINDILETIGKYIEDSDIDEFLHNLSMGCSSEFKMVICEESIKSLVHKYFDEIDHVLHARETTIIGNLEELLCFVVMYYADDMLILLNEGVTK